MFFFTATIQLWLWTDLAKIKIKIGL